MFAVAFAVAPAGAANAGVVAGVSDFEFASFDGQYYLSADDDDVARLRVVETLVAEFPTIDQNRGIVRQIPRSYRGAPLDIQVTSVTDAAGSPVYFETENSDDFVELALGTDDYVHGEQTYVIEYTARDVIQYFPDSRGDEFYWDLNGDGWGQPFGVVSGTVHVDDSLAEHLTGEQACYRGEYGSADRCTIDADGSTYSVSVDNIGAGQNVSVAIGFEGGTVVQPAIPDRHWIVAVAPRVLTGLALLLVLFAIVMRFAVLKNARGRGIVIPEYSVPREIDPLLAGVIIGRQKPSMPAQFVSLAVNRLVDVVDRTPEPGKDDGKYDLVLRRADGATRRETAVLVALFGKKLEPGARIRIDKLGQKKAASLYTQFSKAKTEATKQGITAVPTSPLTRIVSLGGPIIVLGHGLTFIWAVMTVAVTTAVIFFGVVSLVLALIAAFIQTSPPRLTAKGAELKAFLLGVREYLQLAEKDRLRVLQSPQGALRGGAAGTPGEPVDPNNPGEIVTLHEKLLPFAILWSVEKEWAIQLEFDYENANTSASWTVGTRSPSLGGIVGGISVGSASIRPIASSGGGSSESSGFSGSSGGGFSGGGGGGGGGGGR